MNPKVLVGCPTSELYNFCLNKYAEALKNLTYSNYSILLVDNSENKEYIKKIISSGLNAIKYPYNESAVKRIVDSRNLLRKYFLKGNYDYLLSLEQDVIPPKDIIEKLLKTNKEIVSGVYYMPVKVNDSLINFKPLLYGFPTEEEWKRTLKDPKMRVAMKKKKVNSKEDMRRQLTAEEVKGDNIIEVKICGLGCVLMHRSVIEKVEFRYRQEVKCFDDVYFCEDARQQGFRIYANTSVKCEHLFLEKPWHWKDIKL